MSRTATLLRITGVMPDGREYPLFFPRFGRVLCSLAGPYGASVPVVIRYRGSRRQALRLAERIKKKGFRRVTIRRLFREKGYGV